MKYILVDIKFRVLALGLLIVKDSDLIDRGLVGFSFDSDFYILHFLFMRVCLPGWLGKLLIAGAAITYLMCTKLKL